MAGRSEVRAVGVPCCALVLLVALAAPPQDAWAQAKDEPLVLGTQLGMPWVLPIGWVADDVLWHKPTGASAHYGAFISSNCDEDEGQYDGDGKPRRPLNPRKEVQCEASLVKSTREGLVSQRWVPSREVPGATAYDMWFTDKTNGKVTGVRVLFTGRAAVRLEVTAPTRAARRVAKELIAAFKPQPPPAPPKRSKTKEPRSNAECRRSSECRVHGDCFYAEDMGCYNGDPKDCERSEGCRKWGACSIRVDSCAVGSVADCRRSQACKVGGLCKYDEDKVECVR